MKTPPIQLLGISKQAVTILFDLITEVQAAVTFAFYPNIVQAFEVDMPNHSYEYEVMPPGALPDPAQKVFLATPGPTNKAAIFEHFEVVAQLERHHYFQLIAKSAYVAPSARVAAGVLIEPNCTISSQANLGFSVFVKRNSSVGHHSKIGDFTDINPGVTINGDVTIGERCLIGAGAIIRDGVTIGADTTIGMGSVVLTDIPANCIAYGNPCRVIRDK